GFVFAAALGEGDGIRGNGEGAAAETLLHIDENVFEVAAADDDIFGGVRAGTVGILAHVNFGCFRRGAIKFYGSAHAGGGGGINRRGCRGGGARSRWLFFRGLLLAASGQQNYAEQDG